MTEEELKAKAKEDAARADAEPEWAKNLSAKCDAVLKMADSMPSLVKADTETAEMAADKKRADEAEEERKKADAAKADAAKADAAKADAARADKARADAEEEEKKKADAAKADAEKEEEARADAVRKAVDTAVAAATGPLKDQLAALTGAVYISDSDEVMLANIQSRADSALINIGEKAPKFMAGETPINYRRRLASKYKIHSAVWKDKDLSDRSVVADSILDVAEAQIYHELEHVKADSVEPDNGTLRQIVKRDRTGREITEFVGNKRAWMGQFMSAPQLMVKLDKEA
jgi:ATPase subunit of ABC transporter with duplicated ATPase domains